MKKLRLVKVVCQAHFVADDGETLEEYTSDPVAVSAKDWATYPTREFPQGVAQAEEQINGKEGSDAR